MTVSLTTTEHHSHPSPNTSSPPPPTIEMTSTTAASAPSPPAQTIDEAEVAPVATTAGDDETEEENGCSDDARSISSNNNANNTPKSTNDVEDEDNEKSTNETEKITHASPSPPTPSTLSPPHSECSASGKRASHESCSPHSQRLPSSPGQPTTEVSSDQHHSPRSPPTSQAMSPPPLPPPQCEDVAEMARCRAAKFIQERTKMACILNSSAESAESAKMLAAAAASAASQSALGSQTSGSRKRKLTVKDILVSQRSTRGEKAQQSSQSRSAEMNASAAALSQMFAGAGGGVLDPSHAHHLNLNHLNQHHQQQQLLNHQQLHSEGGNNAFAAITAALAAAAAASNGSNSNALADSQSAYISTLANSLSNGNANNNANPTATLALMASLSAMMQQNAAAAAAAASKEAANNAHNPLVSLESTLANVMAGNFSGQSLQNLQQQLQQQSNHHGSEDEDEEDDDEEDDGEEKNHRGGHVPLDFSLKNVFVPKEEESANKSKRKSKKSKGVNGETGGDETPLDLSSKRPDEDMMMSPGKLSDPLAVMFPSQEGGQNGFAAMAAAAAAASFSPNLLTKMMGGNSGGSNWSFGAAQAAQAKSNQEQSAAAAAFSALLQQMNNNAGSNSANNNSNKSSVNNSNTASLFTAQFPDLYQWNGKLAKNAIAAAAAAASSSSTPSPSYGGLGNNSSGRAGNNHHHLHHHQPPPAASQPMRTKSSSGRQNPWQAQWINRSSEQTRDVFTCVWCKESFKSLAEMTDHMKRSPRCGMAGMQQHHSHAHSHPPPPTPTSVSISGGSGGGSGQERGQSGGKMHSNALTASSNALSAALKESSSTSSSSANQHHHHQQQHHHSSSNNNSNHHNSSGNSGGKSQSGVNMPRKLVRGQDVWLGRGAEQTRQILKCMWCGQSFKSLADMTQHMKITQHYTNIISQEQITSWRTPEEKVGAVSAGPGQAAQSQVNAVLTCKVCEEAFGSLKELSNHMIKANHFKADVPNSGSQSTKDSSGRSTPTTSVPIPASAGGRNRTSSSSGANNSTASSTPAAPAPTGGSSSDRRKKSLPVRKLLELERGELKREDGGEDGEGDSPSSASAKNPASTIECDDCHEKIEPRCFLQHIKQCRAARARSLLNKSNGGLDVKTEEDGEEEEGEEDEERKETEEKCQATNGAGDGSESTSSSSTKSSTRKGSKGSKATKGSKKESAKESSSASSAKQVSSEEKERQQQKEAESEEAAQGGSGSVLSALEKLIEKNFDSKSRRSQQTGILQRLGIDEEVFPPWQNMAPSPLSGSGMSPSITWSTISAGLNGQSFAEHQLQQQQAQFCRSNSSSSSSNGRGGQHGGQQPQLRYRRNSSMKTADKLGAGFLSGLSPFKSAAAAPESTGSFSSQETEEEEDGMMEEDEELLEDGEDSCDESNNSDCGRTSQPNRRSLKRPLFGASAGKGGKQSKVGLNFPISSLLSSPPPLPARPTSASSTTSSSIVSPPSEQMNNNSDAHHRMTPSSVRSGGGDDELMGSPSVKRSKLNGDEQQSEGQQTRPQSHNPLFQLQKLLDKTEHTSKANAHHHHSKGHPHNQRMSSPFHVSHALNSSPASSPLATPPPLHSPSSASAKSEDLSTTSAYLTLKCAFCETQIASRAAYRAHLAKVHLAIGRDSAVDLSAISDEELLLLVLAKNSNLQFPGIPGLGMGNSGGGLLAPVSLAGFSTSTTTSTPTTTKAPRGSKRKSAKVSAGDNHHLASWNRSSPSGTASATVPSPQETSQSKFLKYAELAKQLSSKYV